MRPMISKLIQSLEHARLAEGAREIGHGLRARTDSVGVAALRGDIAEVRERVGTETYARGFLDALESVLAGFAAETRHERTLDDDAARIRKNAAKVLLAIRDGCALATEIAQRANLKAPTVSSTLAELEDEGLVERLPPSEGTDRRKIPRRLTPSGQQLVERLSGQAPVSSIEAAHVLAPLFVEYYRRLSDESRVGRARFSELAIEALGTPRATLVADLFLQHALARRVIELESETVIYATALLKGHISQQLSDAMDGKDSGLFAKIEEFAGDARVSLRTTTEMRDRWNTTLASRGLIRRIIPWCADDARVMQFPRFDAPYVVVWDFPAAIADDLRNESIIPVLTNAKKRGCLTTPNLALPSGIERIQLYAG